MLFESSKTLLNIFLKTTSSVIIITFDQYFTPSIKDFEHKLRNVSADDPKFSITGPAQKRTTDFSKALKNISFKEAVVNFIIDHWTSPMFAAFIDNKTIYIDHKKCYKYEVVEGTIVRTVQEDLSCPKHEEADTKIAFHACSINYNAHVSIRCSDTDVAVILLGNMDHMHPELKVWMDIGTGQNRRMFSLNEISINLGADVCAALPAFHALTGCDFNPAFFRKGKNRPLKILRENQPFIESLKNISRIDDPDINLDENFSILEEYICKVYGSKNILVNEVRLEVFIKHYKVVNRKEVLALDKSKFDGSMLPPCKAELRQQFLRTAYIATVWSHAHKQIPTEREPTNYGWIEEDGSYTFHWFDGEQLPSSLKDVTFEDEQLGQSNDNDLEDDDISPATSDSDCTDDEVSSDNEGSADDED